MQSIDKFIEADERLAREQNEGIARHIESVGDYQLLPLAIKMQYTKTEYDWLSDDDKASLIDRSCEPEC